MDPIRVAFITNNLQIGGAERWLVSLATGLDRHTFDVIGIVSTLEDPIHPYIDGKLRGKIPVYLGPKYYRPLGIAANFLIGWGDYDLSSVADLPCTKIHVAQGQCAWTRRCIDKVLPYIDHQVAVSQAAANCYPNAAATTIIPNMVDVNRCTPTKTRTQQRAEWHADPRERLVGYVGRPSDEKNPLAAVYACAALSHPYRPVLCGGGPYKDAYWHMAKRLCPNVILQDEVDNVGNVYHALDCLMLASQCEGHSLALAEAWYCDLPTIATPVGATPELEALHGKLTTTLPLAHTARDLVTAVLAALHPNNPSVRQAHQAAARYLTDTAICRRWDKYLLRLYAAKHGQRLPEPANR